MTISNAFKEHLNGKLDKLQTRVLHNEAKRKELEDALKLISPSYAVESETSSELKELALSVVFNDNPLPFLIQPVKYGDIYISDTDMELLVDFPTMKVGSPSFNAGLKNLVSKSIEDFTIPKVTSGIRRDINQLTSLREDILELSVLQQKDPELAYKELLSKDASLDPDVLNAVKDHWWREESDCIAWIDDVIGAVKKKVCDGDSLIFGNRLKNTIRSGSSETPSEPHLSNIQIVEWSFLMEGGLPVFVDRSCDHLHLPPGSDGRPCFAETLYPTTSMTSSEPQLAGNYNRKRPTPKGGPLARGPLRPPFPIDIDIKSIMGACLERHLTKGCLSQ